MKVRLVLPWLFLLGLFFYVPLFALLALSFARSTTGGALGLSFWPPSLDAFAALASPLYLGVLLSSLRVAAESSLVLVVIGFPFALWLTRLGERAGRLALLLVIVPFLTNFLARVYAWFTLLRPEGLVNALLSRVGLRFDILNTEAAVVLGIVYLYLPFMVVPIFSSLERIDPRVVEAARNLGASPFQVFRSVLFPLALPGVKAGLILVAVPCMGEFVTAKMLGGGKVPLIGMLIEQLFLGRVTPNWPLGSAVTVVLLAFVSWGIVVLRRLTPQERA